MRVRARFKTTDPPPTAKDSSERHPHHKESPLPMEEGIPRLGFHAQASTGPAGSTPPGEEEITTCDTAYDATPPGCKLEVVMKEDPFAA